MSSLPCGCANTPIVAGFAEVAFKLVLVLTILDEKGFAGLFLVAFVAGFSECFVSTLIKRVEMNAASMDVGAKERD